MTGFVYILQAEKSGRYYIGSTGNLDDRLLQHRRGHTSTTKRMGNWKLVFSQEFPLLQEARQIERRIKSWKRRDYIERIIKDKFIRKK